MSHFSTEEWADFARSVISPEECAAMQRHLDSGCGDCRNLLETWKFVADFGAREEFYQPPAHIVRYVKNCKALCEPSGAFRHWKNVARLVFDSLSQPHPAGVRNLGTAPRHLLFKSGSILIDLRLELQAKSRQVCLVGQVLDSSKPIKEGQPVPIILRSENVTVTQTTSNVFGEFQLEFDLAENMVLVVGDDNAIVVPMSDLEPTHATRVRAS